MDGIEGCSSYQFRCANRCILLHCPLSNDIFALFKRKHFICPILGEASPSLSIPPRTADHRAATQDDRPERQFVEMYSS